MIRRIIGEGTGYGPGRLLGIENTSANGETMPESPKTHHRGSAPFGHVHLKVAELDRALDVLLRRAWDLS